MTIKKEGRIFTTPKQPQSNTIDEYASLGHYLLDRLANNPDAVIYVDAASGREWTGAKLREQILDVATALLDIHDFKPGTAMCMCFDNTDHTVIVSLAVICIGGIVATAYHKDPYAELLYTAKKVRPKFLFAHQNNLNWAKMLEADMNYQVVGIAMDDGDAVPSNSTHHLNYLLGYNHTKSRSLQQVPVACKNLSSDVCLVSMSSGTTGKPKAVPLTHGNCLRDLGSRFSKGILNIRFACPASLDYVSGRLILLGAVATGYLAVILRSSEPRLMLEAIERYKISMVYLGAASFYNLITYKDIEHYNISSVRMVFPMGARIVYLERLGEFFKKHPHIAQVRQGFGTSETSGIAMNSMTPEKYLKDSANCGCLMPGASAKIVDPETGTLLGTNQVGLLYVKGVNRFPGYYDISEIKASDSTVNITSIDFNPFVYDGSTFDEDGFYNTDDLAYFNDKEELYIVGRRKEVMSCRGAKKVIPQELEDIISEHPAVSKVCVFGVPSKLDLTLQCPRAFIVPRESYYSNDKLESSSEPSNASQEVLNRRGEHKLCRMNPDKRRVLEEDIMTFTEQRVGWEKQLTGGIVLLDDMPILRETGKVNKSYLRSLTVDQIEVYGDRSS